MTDTLSPGVPPSAPLYKEIAGQMRDALAGGEWKPGEAIPAERRLSSAVRRIDRHGAQGDRRARVGEPADPPAGPRNVRRKPQSRPAAVLLLPHRARAGREAIPRGEAGRVRARQGGSRRGRAAAHRCRRPVFRIRNLLTSMAIRSSSTTSRCRRRVSGGLTEKQFAPPSVDDLQPVPGGIRAVGRHDARATPRDARRRGNRAAARRV